MSKIRECCQCCENGLYFVCNPCDGCDLDSCESCEKKEECLGCCAFQIISGARCSGQLREKEIIPLTYGELKGKILEFIDIIVI